MRSFVVVFVYEHTPILYTDEMQLKQHTIKANHYPNMMFPIVSFEIRVRKPGKLRLKIREQKRKTNQQKMC